MLGIKSQHQPLSGKYADEVMKAIVEMTVHPVKVNKSELSFNFEWSDKEPVM